MRPTTSIQFYIILFVVCVASPLSWAEQTRVQSQAAFIEGEYHLIGKELDSDKTYYGRVAFIVEDGEIRVYRFIHGRTVKGTATIESVTADEVPVLRIRFTEKQVDYEETCLVSGDLDNYARITCHLYRPGTRTDSPGMEALFIRHD
jgi:hypothetical protein